jgi:hypothetical protein
MKVNSGYIKTLIAGLFVLTVAMAGEVMGQQAKTTVVGIDPERNLVRLPNSPSDPLAVKLVEDGSTRKPFQVRIRAVINSGEFKKTESIQIPFGKRFVIENINSYVTRPTGMQVSVQLLANMDSNGDGQLTVDEMGIYYFPTTDQINFSSSTESYANHKTNIFADGNIGNGSQYITFALTLNGTVASTSFGVVTLSGYLEDLPMNQ